MTQQKIRIAGVLVLLTLWAALAGFAWFGAPTDYSYTERRALTQPPELTQQTLLDGSFMANFEKFTQDQFPLRDTFRSVKAVFHLNALQQMDNNGRYLHAGYLENMEDYRLDPEAVNRAAQVFGGVYANLLQGKTDHIYFTLIPAKGYYLAPQSGHMTTDLQAMEDLLLPQIPWAKYVDIKPTLTVEDYYFTDTHWRQEKIVKVAQTLCHAMGTTAATDYTVTAVDRPFYGVYYGQAALPLKPETMYILENDLLDACKVYSYQQGPVANPPELSIYNTAGVQDMTEPYDVFLHGSEETFLVIENPNAPTDQELVVFRDSFGCSLTPLLLADYARVTVIDLRRVPVMTLRMFESRGILNLTNADVLFAYSSLVLNLPMSFQAG